MLVVSNNWAGTADLVDPQTFERLERINVIPDAPERVAEIAADPMATFYFDNIRTLVGEGHNQYVDDGFTSPDGRFVVLLAAELRRRGGDQPEDREIALANPDRRLPRRPHGAVPEREAAAGLGLDRERGRRHRHPDGRDRRADPVRRLAAREQLLERRQADLPREHRARLHRRRRPVRGLATKGKRVFEVIDARTLEVLKTIDMGQKLAEAGYPNMSAAGAPDGDRPERALRLLPGLVLLRDRQVRPERDRVVDVLDLPLADAEGVPRTDFLLDSAHHGLAINPEGTKLCVAGTMSGYAAIVTRKPFGSSARPTSARARTGRHTSEDGEYCFVSVAGRPVAVISFKTGREVDRIKVGYHPQRMRTGDIRAAYLDGAQAARIAIPGSSSTSRTRRRRVSHSNSKPGET